MAIAIVAADPGYLSDNNLALEEELEVELLIATKSRRQTAQNGKPPRGRIPHGLSRTQLMERKWKRAGELERRWAEAEWPVSVHGPPPTRWQTAAALPLYRASRSNGSHPPGVRASSAGAPSRFPAWPSPGGPAAP